MPHLAPDPTVLERFSGRATARIRTRQYKAMITACKQASGVHRLVREMLAAAEVQLSESLVRRRYGILCAKQCQHPLCSLKAHICICANDSICTRNTNFSLLPRSRQSWVDRTRNRRIGQNARGRQRERERDPNFRDVCAVLLRCRYSLETSSPSSWRVARLAARLCQGSFRQLCVLKKNERQGHEVE